MGSVDSATLMRTLYAQLIAYTDDSGRTLNTLLAPIGGGNPRIYTTLAPDGADYPYIVMRKGSSESDQEVGNLRERYDVEVRCMHRARDNEDDLEIIADLVEGAFVTWRESSPSLGVSFCQTITRETVAPEQDPPNRDLAEIILVATCISWSIMLSNALT
jgi:hypothetical protein